MATLYLTQQGTTVRREDNRLAIERDGARIAAIHDFRLERVVIFGNVQLTTQAIAFLLDRGIDTAFLTVRGRLKGRLTAVESKNAPLRMLQYERTRDEGFALAVAGAVVEGKIRNGAVVLARHARNHPECDFADELSQLEALGRRAPRADGVESLRGFEGQAAAVYFRGFARTLRRELRFEKRVRRPPTDPVNAMLSFGYTMLYNEAIGALAAVGFDPYLGFYHAVDYGRCSLALDLIEELRHVAVDRMVARVVNREVLTAEDFGPADEAGVRMSDAARGRFLEQYERAMTAEFTHRRTGAKTSFRRTLHEQAQALRRTVADGAPYEPFAGWH